MHSRPTTRPLTFAGYQSAEAWRAQHPATRRILPTTPPCHLKLALLAFALVLWVIIGGLVAKYCPPLPRPPAPTERGWLHDDAPDFSYSDSTTL